MGIKFPRKKNDMLKLILLILFNFIYLNISVANSTIKNNIVDCSWANSHKTPCIKIIKKISNTSKFNESSLNKYTITREEINKIGAIDLVDVLKTIPSMNLTQSGPKGQQTSVFLRGTGSNHTLVMINGIPINDQSTTQGLHDFGVDFIQTIQQIEVFPGSSAAQFGTNAIGGAINIILTGDYKDKINISSDNEFNYDFLANKSFVNDQNSLNFKLGIVKHETISARKGTSEDKDKVQNYSTNINHENFISPKTKIFNTFYFRNTIAEYDDSSSNQVGYEADNKMLTLQSGYNTVDKNLSKKLVLYYTKYDREYDEKGTIDNYYSNVVGSKYDFSKNLNEKVSFGFGGDYKYDWGKFNNRGSYQASTKGNSDNLALFSNIGINLKKNTNLSFFLRNDDHKYSGDNSTYKINLNQKFGIFDFGISRMTGLRNPTLYELFGTDNFGYSGNRDLNAEKSLTNEISLKVNLNSRLNFSSVFFRSNISNNIEYVSNQYINDNDDIDLNQSGIDNHVQYKTDNSDIKFFTSFLSSKKENSSDQLRRPEKVYGLSYLKTFNKNKYSEFDMNISYKHYGKHFDTHSSNFSTIEMDSTDIVNFNLNKKLNNSSVFLRISNLFDENYQRPHGYNQEKRQIRVGLKY